jgi:hypothetical protein
MIKWKLSRNCSSAKSSFSSIWKDMIVSLSKFKQISPAPVAKQRLVALLDGGRFTGTFAKICCGRLPIASVALGRCSFLQIALNLCDDVPHTSETNLMLVYHGYFKLSLFIHQFFLSSQNRLHPLLHPVITSID